MNRSLLLASLLAVGCSHLKYAEIPEYKINKLGPFIVSESPELWRFYERNYGKDSERNVQFLVSNADSREHSLQLDKARIIANQEVLTVKCEDVASKESGSKKLSAGVAIKVKCPLNLSPNSANQLGMRDTIVRLEVPTDGKEVVALERIYRIEQFQ
ncbi:hypothetical protein [Bdellovibrio sp. HCB209]|uniref:hypothetical protein n=1 Tax=Bdellovibrio sp. HCB209 TaxID=3394354 RepID=UPI0039B5DB5A